MTQFVRDEFESITESAPLVEELRARIAANGPITFEAFMRAALYHPRWGYYNAHADAMSRGGDYVTSPEVHPIFGALLARHLRQLWDVMGRPARFDVVEQGGGAGLLARDILHRGHSLEPEFADALRYQIVEISPALQTRQQRTIDDAGLSSSVVDWLDALPDAIDGCVLSNELVDAFPVHRIVRRDRDLREIHVGYEHGHFLDVEVPCGPEIRRYFDDLGVLPGEGCFAEVNLAAPAWVASVGAALKRGYVLTFDYGYEARQLYAPWRHDGTLLCFYRQSASSDPYQRIGKQDMTSSVDFTTLKRAGDAIGLRTIALTDQTAFLTGLGIGDGIASVARERPGEMEEYFARRRVVMDLIDPGRLGRITVLLQGKDVPDAPLDGFASE